MPQPDFQIKVGDNASSIFATLEDAAGTPVDIEAATVKFRMAPISGGAAVLEAAATNAQNGSGTSDHSVGNVSYAWVPGTAGTLGDTDTAGFYLGEWEVTYASGTVETFPNGGYVLIEVTEALA